MSRRDAEPSADAGGPWSRAWGGAGWLLAATLVFGLALATPYGDVWTRDLTAFIPRYMRDRPLVDPPAGKDLPPIDPRKLYDNDQRFATWGVARNTHALLSRPTRLFDAEQCYPAPNTLALGEPMLTLGVLGIPAYLLTGDPVATYNCAVIATTILAAFAMYLLIAEWTGVPAAGIVAGLLYAFHYSKLWNVVHVYVDDTAWMVIGLLFARRFFARGHWGDAIGLGLACALQAATSFYPFLAAVFFAIPLLVWLLWHYGVRRLRVAPLVLALGIMGAAALVVFVPYLEWRQTPGLLRRSFQVFDWWSAYLPGQYRFPGWVFLALILVGLLAPRRRAASALTGDPRWALVAGALLVAVMASGGNWRAQLEAYVEGRHVIALPNPYALLSSVLPGLDAVRAPAALSTGVLVALGILAGFGAAALLTVVPPRWRTVAAVGLIGAAYVDTLRPAYLGLQPRMAYSAFEVAPPRALIESFQALERLGNSGPIIEVPPRSRFDTMAVVLLSAYHHRSTSACYATFGPPVMQDVEKLIADIPAPHALAALRDLGFTTLVVHEPDRLGRALVARIEAAPGDDLKLIRRDRWLAAYELVVPDGRAPRPALAPGS